MDLVVQWATVGLLVVTAAYATLTYYILETTKRQAKAALLGSLLSEYGSRRMGKAMRALRAWKTEHPNDWVPRYEAALRPDVMENPGLQALDLVARRTVSHYFSRLQALIEHNLIEAKLVADVLGAETIDFYLDVVSPLDNALRRAEGKPENVKGRLFFEKLRREQFA